MKLGFYPKMAANGMRKNGRLYTPYLVTCIMMVAVYYILHFQGSWTACRAGTLLPI